MQTIYKDVPIGQIEILHNYREVSPPTEKDTDIIELSNDIKVKGVMQPVMLRPHPSAKNSYQIIYGHRRFLASQLAGKTTLPAIIREVADDQVLEMQVTENLQRKDVHPMDEAAAYKQLMNQKKYSVQEISVRFAKSPEYITHRLKLNELVPELQKDFKQDKMLLGHALLLCRLTEKDQRRAREWADGKSFSNEKVADVKEWIEEEIMQDLSKVSWKLDDAALFPQAGACSACPKRTGAGNLLFADMAADNRCMDSHCFKIKKDKALMQDLTRIIEANPDIHLLTTAHAALPVEINNYLQKMKIKTLKEYDDFKTSDWDSSYQIKSRGFYLTGWDQGKVKTIYLKGKKTSAAKGTSGKAADDGPPVTVVIADIKERTKRAAELDHEKVHTRVVEALKKCDAFKQIDHKMKDMPEAETVAMLFILFNDCPHSLQRDIVSKLKLKGTNGYGANEKAAKEFYNSLRELSAGELAYMVRRIMLENYPGTTAHSDRGFILRKIAESFTDIPIADFEKEQAEIRLKREQRATERINALSKTVKPAAKKAPKKTGKKAARKK